MTRDDRAYSRIYHESIDDPKFTEVWGDDACLALWVRMLVTADQSWPASAPLSRSTKPRPLGVLVRACLVDLHPDGHHYRVHGLDKERSRRSSLASHAAQSRWYADSNAVRIADSNANGHADGNAVSMPRRERVENETSQGVDGGTARDPETSRLVRVEDGR